MQNDILLKHLSTIVDPELGVDIVELGMVKDISFVDSTVVIKLALSLAFFLAFSITELLSFLLIAVTSISTVSTFSISRSFLLISVSIWFLIGHSAIVNANLITKIDPQTRVIAIGSGKGGVGKSTISTNIALGLEKQGYKTGLLDADIWGFSIPRLLGIKARLEADDDKNIIPYKKGNLEVVSTGLITEDEDTALMWRGLMLSKALT